MSNPQKSKQRTSPSNDEDDEKVLPPSTRMSRIQSAYRRNHLSDYGMNPRSPEHSNVYNSLAGMETVNAYGRIRNYPQDVMDFTLGYMKDPELLNEGLFEAARNGQFQQIELLLESGADINYFHPDELKSVVEIASENGHLTVVKYLAERGAAILNDALNASVIRGQLEVVKYLLQLTPAIPIDLYSIVECESPETVQYIHLNVMDLASPVNGGTSIAENGLSYAIAMGNLNMVRCFHEVGVNITMDHVYQALDNPVIVNINVIRYLVRNQECIRAC